MRREIMASSNSLLGRRGEKDRRFFFSWKVKMSSLDILNLRRKSSKYDLFSKKGEQIISIKSCFCREILETSNGPFPLMS